MEEQELNIDYDNILETLINTFGDVLSKDVYIAIIESCKGDLEQSANAVISITTDGNDASENNEESTESRASNNIISPIVNQDTRFMHNVPNISSTTNNTVPFNTVTMTSYAESSQSTRPLLQQMPKPTMSTSYIPQNIWTNQLRQILAQHENGARILIIMRGLPGSGKSYLAKKIIDSMYGVESEENYYLHILSTDHFFMQRGVYIYNRYRLGEAHAWNQNRSRQAMSEGISPIIIDNTNVRFFEMEPYVIEGVKNGYIIEVVEPNTPWARKANQLQRRNIHGVPLLTIRNMLDNYENDITGAMLMKRLNCYYPLRMQPPVLRNIPPFIQRPLVTNTAINERGSACLEDNISKEIQNQELSQGISQPSTSKAQYFIKNNDRKESAALYMGKETEISDIESIRKDDINKTDLICETRGTNQIYDTNKADERGLNENYMFTEIQRSLEEMEKVEKEWDFGEGWEGNLKNRPKNVEHSIDAKPQRKNKGSRSLTAEKLFPNAEDCHDWSKMFLPSWAVGNSSSVTEKDSPVLEKISCGTCVEVGDTDIYNLKPSFKIITASPRNINQFYTAPTNNKIPGRWMLDKSTSTNIELLTDNKRCPYEEQHFASLRKLFKHVAREDLREIFNNCHGDVYWAVNILLDGMKNKTIHTVAEVDDISDSEDETHDIDIDLCKCLSDYGISPGNNEPTCIIQRTDSENSNKTPTPSLQMRKVKKDCVVSEASIELKRQIEQNIVIPDSHYSQHCLKIRKFRRCEDDCSEYVNTENTTPESSDHPPVQSDIQIPSTSGNRELVFATDYSIVPSTSKAENIETSDDESYVGLEDVEKTVNINLGKEFIAQLDELFGRNMEYPENINPRINMPMSLLNEINALWMESLMHQLEEDAHQSELMIQQDEEFARQLAMKEAELSRAGKEPEVPDFKEIMDMDFALSLYHKDVAELRDKSKPQDLAAKLSRDKLYNLFPDISPDILSELLQAHEENFQATVEILLISTDKTDVLKDKDGVNKFILKRELERQQEKLAREEKKTLSEVEWPLPGGSKGVKANLSYVKQLRDEAEAHLQTRNLQYCKAQDYIRRGMTQVASYYSDVAAYHKRKYELANSMAAALLIQVNAANRDSSTVDLHYLKVAEAREALDLFLDYHIRKLQENQEGSTPARSTLFLITGRGLHSAGGPRVKPAVQHRLRERGLSYVERNPGLLQARVSAVDKLSHQIP